MEGPNLRGGADTGGSVDGIIRECWQIIKKRFDFVNTKQWAGEFSD